MSNSTLQPPVSTSPTVPTAFVTDSGTAVPAANILNVVTPGSGTQGIVTSGSGNTVTISLIDAVLTGTAQTVNAGTANINVNIPLPTNESAITIRANLVGYAKSSGLAIGGELIGTVRNVGGVLTVIQIPEVTKNNDSVLATWSATLVISGTDVLVQVTGVNTYTINWTAIIDSVTASEGQA